MGTNHGFFELIFTFLIASYVSAQFSDANNEVCMSPNRRSGKCLNIKSCPDLLNLLQQKPLNESTIKFLQQSQCGYENRDPKVCCTNSNNQFNSSRLLDEPKNVPMNVENPSLKSIPMNVTNHPNLRLLGGGKQCARNLAYASYIVGGTHAKLYAYPFMALIAYRNARQLSSKTEFQCGGTIINKRYILTAAHCVTNLRRSKYNNVHTRDMDSFGNFSKFFMQLRIKPQSSNKRHDCDMVLYGVRVGEYDLSTEEDCLNFRCVTYQDFLIESYHYHPKYSTTTFMNDVALIRVNRDMDLTVDNAKPICLPITDLQMEDYRQMTVAGWGTTRTSRFSPVLLEVSLPHFSQNECVKYFKGRGLPVTPKQICYGGELGKDSCQGDSGGPLFSTKIGYYVQYGIVSYGSANCAKTQPDVPGVYTRVDQYVDWILDTLRD